jgi:hypothetical protein
LKEATVRLSKKLEKAIIKVYLEFGIPADALVCDCLLAGHFADRVNEEIAPDEYYSTITINNALFSLRKRGSLPRLER